jgi:hypothetical protein
MLHPYASCFCSGVWLPEAWTLTSCSLLVPFFRFQNIAAAPISNRAARTVTTIMIVEFCASAVAAVGERVGAAVGERVGAALGERVGSTVGEGVGAAVGERVGAAVGERVGSAVGKRVGAALGERVGAAVGEGVGA